MPGVERSDHEKRIAEEIGWCYTYEPETECRGASGRKLRRVCAWCPNYQRWKRKEEREHGNESEDNH